MRRAAFAAFAVDEIEFEFERRHRLQLHFGETFEHAFQRGARLGRMRRAGLVAQCHQHLRALRSLAPHRRNRLRNRPRRTVGIAVADALPERIDHLAARIHQIDRKRNLHAGFEQLGRAVHGQALAAQRAADVGKDRIDEFDVRMLLQQHVQAFLRGLDESGPCKTGHGNGLVHGDPIIGWRQ